MNCQYISVLPLGHFATQSETVGYSVCSMPTGWSKRNSCSQQGDPMGVSGVQHSTGGQITYLCHGTGDAQSHILAGSTLKGDKQKTPRLPTQDTVVETALHKGHIHHHTMASLSRDERILQRLEDCRSRHALGTSDTEVFLPVVPVQSIPRFMVVADKVRIPDAVKELLRSKTHIKLPRLEKLDTHYWPSQSTTRSLPAKLSERATSVAQEDALFPVSEDERMVSPPRDDIVHPEPVSADARMLSPPPDDIGHPEPVSADARMLSPPPEELEHSEPEKVLVPDQELEDTLGEMCVNHVQYPEVDHLPVVSSARPPPPTPATPRKCSLTYEPRTGHHVQQHITIKIPSGSAGLPHAQVHRSSFYFPKIASSQRMYALGAPSAQLTWHGNRRSRGKPAAPISKISVVREFTGINFQLPKIPTILTKVASKPNQTRLQRAYTFYCGSRSVDYQHGEEETPRSKLRLPAIQYPDLSILDKCQPDTYASLSRNLSMLNFLKPKTSQNSKVSNDKHSVCNMDSASLQDAVNPDESVTSEPVKVNIVTYTLHLPTELH